MSRVQLWASIFVAAEAIAGCGARLKSSSTDRITESQDVASRERDSPTSVEAYFPAADGTIWKWRLTITVGDGKGPLKPTVITDSIESKVAGREKINGAECLRIESTDRIGNVVQTEYVSIAADGHYRHGMNQDRFVPPLKILALPAKVGTAWNGKYTVQGMQISTKSRIVAEETVTVPAGTFKAIRVEVKPDPELLTTTTWYAAGIGVVKQTIRKPIQSQTDQMELEVFTVGESRKME